MQSKEDSFFARHRFSIAITTLMGTIIGAGILGIPYVIAKAGYLYGLLIMAILGVAYIFLNLLFGEVVLRTQKQHQLPGYAEKYLGPAGKKVAGVAMIIGVYGALSAYLIGVGEAVFAIFQWGTPLLYTFVFFILCVLILLGGVRMMGRAELFLIPILILVVLGIGFVSVGKLDYHSLASWDSRYLFLPYGILIFAYMGFAAIPEMQEIIGREKKKLKSAIIIGSVIPIVVYILFSFLIIGLVGIEQFELLQPNQRIATVALSAYANPILGVLANLLAVLAMFTSFLSNGLALKEVYHYDFRLSEVASLFLTLLVPLLISVFGVATFMTILAITGALAGGLQGIILIFVYWRAQRLGDRKPEYVLGRQWIVGSLLVLMFGLGIVYTFWEYSLFS